MIPNKKKTGVQHSRKKLRKVNIQSDQWGGVSMLSIIWKKKKKTWGKKQTFILDFK